MDPGGSSLDSSLPQPDNPCLIVEDSQPDSAALEDDPDSSYRALLARRLSSLQPATSHSPVLELITSPAGSKCSDTDSQSERVQNNVHNMPVNQEESEVLDIYHNTRRCGTGDLATESGADSTTHCTQSDGVSQFGFLELSESQGLGEAVRNSRKEEGATAVHAATERQNTLAAEQKSLPSGSQDSQLKSVPRSEVSSSSSSEPPGRAGRQLNVQALLHSEGLDASDRQDPNEDQSELLSSQEDLFDVDRTGTGVDSTVSEPENQRVPTLTPAHTLRLLHLSGQGTLVQESLSQNSVEFVCPTQDNLNQTPFFVPNSPTGRENELAGADEPMDTSLPPEDQSDGKVEEPMDMDPDPKPLPSASTPVSQHSPGFLLERSLSMPSQPELSHDVFAPTQSQKAEGTIAVQPLLHNKKVTSSSSSSSDPTTTDSSSPKMTAPSKAPTTNNSEHPVAESFQLKLSVNTQSCHEAELDVEDDSQATQIDGLDGPLQLNVTDSAMSLNTQKNGSNGASSEAKNPAVSPSVSHVPDLQKTSLESPSGEECNASPKSDTHKQTSVNVHSVNVGDGDVTKAGNSQMQPSNAASRSPSPSSLQNVKIVDSLTPISCVQETPSSSNNAACGGVSQSAVSQGCVWASRGAPSPRPGVGVDPQSERGGGAAGGGGLGRPKSPQGTRGSDKSSQPMSQDHGEYDHILEDIRGAEQKSEEELMEEEDGDQQESKSGAGGSNLFLALSQSQLVSPEPMEEEGDEETGRGGQEESVGSIIVLESERSSQLLEPEEASPTKKEVSSNGTGPQLKETQPDPIRKFHAEKGQSGETEGLHDKSINDSSGENPFQFTLPKEGELIGPAVSATPPLISQLKQTPRHSTPIEMTSFEKSAGACDVSTETVMATSDITAGESGEDTPEGADGKLSLRMKLVTPVEEGSSERFSLQKPQLTAEEVSVSKVTTVAKAVTSSLPSSLPGPSVFSRVREAHRQGVEEETQPDIAGSPVREDLFSSPPRRALRPSLSSPSLGSFSLPNSQSEPASSPRPKEASMLPQGLTEKEPPSKLSTPGCPAVPTPQTATTAGERETCGPPEPSGKASSAHQRAVAQQTSFDHTASPSSPSKRAVSQQTSFDATDTRTPADRGEPQTPPSRASAVPNHRRHVRTIQEVRTTVTRIITDVYYEDGREVDRKVTEESEEPVLDSRVLDSDISPCRTGSSMTSGDLGDVSSLSSKTSSLQHSSGSISAAVTQRDANFIMPPSRGAKSASPRRGSGQHQRGHRGQVVGSEFMEKRGHGALGSPAFTILTPRGRAKRGRPPSRSPLSRRGGTAKARGQPLSSSDDEPFNRLVLPPQIQDSALVPSFSSTSLLTTSPDGGSLTGSSFVGLRVVAKWSSNGYFYSGRITKDLGEGRFRLLFDDSYECEVSGKDILLCDPIPMETEVTALLEDEYFSTGLVKGHRMESGELFYSVEKQSQTTAPTDGEKQSQTTAPTDGERKWYSRSSVILTMEQGNRLREQYGLAPYEPATPLAKASDISLDNLVEGKRKRRGNSAGAQGTPTRSSDSPRTPGPSGKRKLMSTVEDREKTPAKRGRRGGGGSRAAQRVGVCNTSGSGTDLHRDPGDLEDTHGPLPQSPSLFMGFAFMLTASSESDRQTNQLVSDGEEEYVQTAPYNKRYTETQLEAGGGFILPDFNEEQCKAAYQSLLIADQHCRTRKYLLCVASGVPCVSHIWVRDCCKDGKLLNYRNYLLPAGLGPDERIVEWHPRCSPFKALRVLLVFEEPVELWSELLTMSGAASVKQHQADKDSSDIPKGKFDVVVTDRSCPPLVQKNVASQGVPMVSPEWLIHSLICGQRLEYHSNPEYRHDYSTPPSS
ncbi:hypothetical protein UPYG_G00088060 [Umbra pygmaea]|uniref:BRCT domain-containing protein n=1 Tax=Umbra pygmaea TaxID=75934 RepID=A0ABD0Y2M2_UMBPY